MSLETPNSSLIENLTPEQIFDHVRNGLITLEQFLDWHSNRLHSAYVEGSDMSSYYHAQVSV